MDKPVPRHCMDCGLLGLRAVTGELIEADEDYRREQEWKSNIFNSLPMPICAAGRAYYIQETLDQMLGDKDKANEQFRATHFDRAREPVDKYVLVFIHRERFGCSDENRLGWVKHQPGLNPKEHREMLDREFMLKRADRLDKEMRDREDIRDKAQSDNHTELIKQARTFHWRELLVFGVAIIVITLIGSLIDSGLWTPPFTEREPNEVITIPATPVPPTATLVPPTPIQQTSDEERAPTP